MKKIILTVAGVFALSFANAQSYTKPAAGDMQLEVTFTPNLSSDAMFANPTFYGTEAAGIRLRKFSSSTKALRLTGHLSYNDSGVDGTESAMALAASVGIENHMKGTDRLSTFWGYEGTLLYAKNELKTTTIAVGAQLFTGCDYYIMPNVYLGAEVNFGLSVASTKPDAGDGVTSISLNPGINPNLRLGWRF